MTQSYCSVPQLNREFHDRVIVVFLSWIESFLTECICYCSVPQLNREFHDRVIVVFLSWTLWGSPSFCNCTLMTAFHGVRRLGVWQFVSSLLHMLHHMLPLEDCVRRLDVQPCWGMILDRSSPSWETTEWRMVKIMTKLQNNHSSGCGYWYWYILYQLIHEKPQMVKIMTKLQNSQT